MDHSVAYKNDKVGVGTIHTPTEEERKQQIHDFYYAAGRAFMHGMVEALDEQETYTLAHIMRKFKGEY